MSKFKKIFEFVGVVLFGVSVALCAPSDDGSGNLENQKLDSNVVSSVDLSYIIKSDDLIEK